MEREQEKVCLDLWRSPRTELVWPPYNRMLCPFMENCTIWSWIQTSGFILKNETNTDNKNKIKIKTQNRSDKIIIVIQRKWVLKERIYSKRTTPFLFLSIILGMAQVLKRQHENKARFVLENILAFFLWLKITTASWWRKLYISKSPVNQVCMCFHF